MLGNAVKSPRRTGIALSLIVGLYLCFGAWHLAATPMFEKPDEEWHAAYVAYLAERGQLPPLVIDEDLNPAYQIAGHPPLYYATSALIIRALGLQLAPPALDSNPFWAYPAPGTVPDNKNRFLHSPAEISQPEFAALYLLRGLSLILGIGTIIAAFGIGRVLTGQAMLGLMSAALVAVLPQYTFIASSISHDALVASLSGLGILALVFALTRDDAWKYWIFFGGAAGLAALTKASALLLPLFGAAVAVAVGVHRRSKRTAIRGVGASLGLWLVICGWWYVRNATLYGDPLGIGVHVARYGQSTVSGSWSLSGLWVQTSVTFWAAFGWSNVQLPPWVYLALRITEVLALVGLLWMIARNHRQLPNKLAWGVVGGYTILMLAAYLWWTTTVTGTLGRLLFPALAPLAFLMCAGLKRWSAWLLAAAWGLVATAALLAPAFIAPAYQPLRTTDQLSVASDLKPLAVTFDDLARLSAVQVAPQRLAPGEPVGVTLCWQPLQDTEQNYAVFVQIVGEGDEKVGERNTYPGLGRNPTSQWHPGQSFCDRVDVPIQPNAPVNAIYSVVAGLQDLDAEQPLSMSGPDGRPIDSLVVDQIKVTGSSPLPPTTAVSVDANFANQITLVGYELGTINAQDQVPLTLYWQARAPLATNYTVFVHALDTAGNLLAQADSPPQQGRYPTGWWDVGEIVADRHILQLPGNLVSGTYRVLVGLYVLETGERLKLTDSQQDSLEIQTIQTLLENKTSP